MNRPKILLADDHVLIAQALEHLLQAEFDVVGTVSDGRALLKAAGELSRTSWWSTSGCRCSTASTPASS